MSAAKHTPGPWEVLDGRRVGVTLPSKVDGCGFGSHCIALTHSDRDEIDAEANARLIAAAPELLEALTAFVDFPADTFEGDEDGAFTMTVRLNDLRAARAAILKAAGEGA